MIDSLRLQGFRVAILVEDGFEQLEMTGPREALEAAGARAFVVSPRTGEVRGFTLDELAEAFPVDIGLSDANPSDFDALLLPGGLRSADALRINNRASLFVHAFDLAKKPVAAIGYGPWMLVEAGMTRSRKMTSGPSLRTDIMNAGADWTDDSVVSDALLVTCKTSADVPRFNKAMLDLFSLSQNGATLAVAK